MAGWRTKVLLVVFVSLALVCVARSQDAEPGNPASGGENPTTDAPAEGELLAQADEVKKEKEKLEEVIQEERKEEAAEAKEEAEAATDPGKLKEKIAEAEEAQEYKEEADHEVVSQLVQEVEAATLASGDADVSTTGASRFVKPPHPLLLDPDLFASEYAALVTVESMFPCRGVLGRY
jgi:hypothetical protein